MAAICHDIEGLGFDGRSAWRGPLEIFALHFGPWYSLRLVRDRMESGAAVDGFLDADAVALVSNGLGCHSEPSTVL